MFNLRGLIIKDDDRYDYASTYLKEKGVIIEENFDNLKDLDFILFPFKEDVDIEKFNDRFFESLSKNALLLSGVRNNFLEKMSNIYKLDYFPLMEEKSVSVMNAVPTSEGIISHIIQSTNMPVFDSHILVIGYGVCGQDLCKRLNGLNANAYTLVRNDVKEARAIANGVKPVYIEDIYNYSFDVIVNTVPNKVLEREHIERFKDTLIIDISSKPHGFDVEYMKSINENFVVLSSIPSKCAVKFAGEILAKNIYRKVKSC
nr:hypothetical protein [Clostridioides sp.]